MNSILKIGGRLYFYTCTITAWEELQRIKRRYPQARYYYIKAYNAKGERVLHIYLDHYIRG